MVVFGTGDEPRHAEGGPPYLVVRLKPGWIYVPKPAKFVSETGNELVLDLRLPDGSRIVQMVQELSEAREPLSQDEEILARYLLLILPQGADPEEILPNVRQCESIEKAELPPEISLPVGLVPPL